MLAVHKLEEARVTDHALETRNGVDTHRRGFSDSSAGAGWYQGNPEASGAAHAVVAEHHGASMIFGVKGGNRRRPVVVGRITASAR